MEGSSLETFLIVGRVSSEAVIESKLLKSKSYFTRIHVWFEELLLEARFFGLQFALWLLKIQSALTLWRLVWCRRFIDSHWRKIYILCFAASTWEYFLGVAMLQRYIRCCFWYVCCCKRYKYSLGFANGSSNSLSLPSSRLESQNKIVLVIKWDIFIAGHPNKILVKLIDLLKIIMDKKYSEPGPTCMKLIKSINSI